MAELDMSKLPRTIWLEAGEADGIFGVYLVDQTRLPLQGDILCCRTMAGVETAIRSLAVRGAPALGIAAAMALVVWSYNESEHRDVQSFLEGLSAAAERISQVRPTAVNLSWGARELYRHACYLAGNIDSDNKTQSRSNPACAAGEPADTDESALLNQIKAGLVEFACAMAKADEATNRAIGANGATLLKPNSKVLTICNAGSLATAFYGTAVGVMYKGFEQGLVEHVWACETRPLNQGARLTLWELMTCGVPVTLIADSMAASCMAKGLVDCVIVGADRICANGDTANKVGTLNLAVLARHFGVPFYVAAPLSSFDAGIASGKDVLIEQRDTRELAGFSASALILPGSETETRALDLLTQAGEHLFNLRGGHQMAIARKGGAYSLDAWFATTPPGASIYNPAFDVTPHELITAIVSEAGIYEPPFDFAALLCGELPDERQ